MLDSDLQFHPMEKNDHAKGLQLSSEYLAFSETPMVINFQHALNVSSHQVYVEDKILDTTKNLGKTTLCKRTLINFAFTIQTSLPVICILS